MEKVINFISKFYIVFIAVAVVTATLFTESTEVGPAVLVARITTLIPFCIIGVITYFLIYGFFLLIYKVFGTLLFSNLLDGKKLVIIFSNVALIMYLLSYVLFVLMLFMKVSTPAAVVAIAAILGIIKFRKQKA